MRDWLLAHLSDHYSLYGEEQGVRSARKHIGWAVQALPGGAAFRAAMNRIDTAQAQWTALHGYLDELARDHVRWPDNPPDPRAPCPDDCANQPHFDLEDAA